MVAPYESCIRCSRGDTTTGFASVGDAEFHAAIISVELGMGLDEALATIAVVAEAEMGRDPGKVPDGTFTVAFRLCRECAQITAVPIAALGSANLPGFRQTEETQG